MNTDLYIVQQVINAVSLGSLYALVAIGLSMVFGILRMTNFAHGDMMMVGAFATLVLGVARPALLAGGARRHGRRRRSPASSSSAIAYRPVRGAPDVTLLLTSLAVTYILENLGILHLHLLAAQLSDPRLDERRHPVRRTARSPSPQINVADGRPDRASRSRLLGWFVTRTDAGLGMRAAAEDIGAAPPGRPRRQPADRRRLRHRLGLRRPRRRAVGGAVGHRRAAHGLHAAAQGVRGRDHRRLRLASPARCSAAIVLGALEVFIVAFLPSEVSPYRDAIVFALLIAFLLFRPNGLLNRTQEVKL